MVHTQSVNMAVGRVLPSAFQCFYSNHGNFLYCFHNIFAYVFKATIFHKKRKILQNSFQIFFFFVKSHHLIWLTLANQRQEILVYTSTLPYCHPYFPSWLLHCSMYIQEWNFKFPPSWCIADRSSTSPAPLAVLVTANCRGQASDCGCDCAFQYVFARLQCW